jgi:3-oxoacyl-[acyl-carrier protein] reductase
VTVIVLAPAAALSTALINQGDVVSIDDTTDPGEMMWQALVALQTARSSNTRRVVLIVPTIGMAGAPAAVSYTTAIEGVRAMAKSAARQWSSAGVGVNIVAAPAHLFARDVDSSHLTAAAVVDAEALIHSVIETVRFLLRDDLEPLTGATIVVDGGSVMLP